MRRQRRKLHLGRPVTDPLSRHHPGVGRGIEGLRIGRARLLLVLWLALGLVVAPVPVTADQQTASSIAVTGCMEHVGIFAVPAESVAHHIPDGFAPADPFGLDPTGSSAGIFVTAARCGHVMLAPGLTLDDEHTSFVMLAVEPPADLALDGALFHSVPLLILSESPEAVAHGRQWGPNVGTGVVTLQDHLVFGRGQAMGRGASVDLHTIAGPSSEVAGSVNRMFNVVNDRVVYATDVTIGAAPQTVPLPATATLDGLQVPTPLTGVGLHLGPFDADVTSQRMTRT